MSFIYYSIISLDGQHIGNGSVREHGPTHRTLEASPFTYGKHGWQITALSINNSGKADDKARAMRIDMIQAIRQSL